MKFLLFIFAFCFLFFNCNYQQVKTEAPQVNIVKLNKKFKINLPEEHNSGYMWQLNDKYDKNHIEHLNDVWHGNEKGIDFNFNALSVGEVTLSFIKRKYVDTIDNKTFIVRISE